MRSKVIAPKEMMTVEQYAAQRIGWRGYPVNPSYIYKLIKQYEKGEKSISQIGFKPVESGKGYLIQLN